MSMTISVSRTCTTPRSGPFLISMLLNIVRSIRCCRWTILCFLCLSLMYASAGFNPWTPIVVKNVTLLGSQTSPSLTNVSRDGGYSVLLSQRIVWLYDDTECISADGKQLSFVSNTAAYAANLTPNRSTITDFGVVMVGHNQEGFTENALLGNDAVGGGGWIPFDRDELEFNERNKGRQRIAIWPGTSPAPVDKTVALLYAPMVYVDSKPSDPGARYTSRGMTLVSVMARADGPLAVRRMALLFPGDHVPFGGFATLIGSSHLEQPADSKQSENRDVYLLGAASSGLQLARVSLDAVEEHSAYSFYQARHRTFSSDPPRIDVTDPADLYLHGTFTSGNVFFSPYFHTFLLTYFNKMVDSTFYLRFLDLDRPLDEPSVTWTRGGKNGRGIGIEDVEALVKYAWSAEQVLYRSPPAPGGFNYAGVAHPEYFNRRYYPDSETFRFNDIYPGVYKPIWYGGDVVGEPTGEGADGKHLLISWTAQERGGLDTGIYGIQLAVVEFGNIPARPSSTSSTTTTTTTTASAIATASRLPTAAPHRGQGSERPAAITPTTTVLIGLLSGRPWTTYRLTIAVVMIIMTVVVVITRGR